MTGQVWVGLADPGVDPCNSLLSIEGLHGEHLILHLLVVQKVHYVGTGKVRHMLKVIGTHTPPYTVVDTPC